MKLYKIGDYAKKLGVTADYLKHYEECGLLEPKYSESGYRYFEFTQTPIILSSICLRNMGFTVKNTYDMLRVYEQPQIQTTLAEKRLEIEKQIQYNQVILEEMQALERYLDKKQPYTEWFIKEKPEFYYLVHSNEFDFIDDSKILKLVKIWLSFMPMVKSARKIYFDVEKQAFIKHQCWGLSVSMKYAKLFNLPIKGDVELIPTQKYLEYHYYGVSTTSERAAMSPSAYIETLLADVMKIIEQNNFKIVGDIYEEVVFRHQYEKTANIYRIYYFPIEK